MIHVGRFLNLDCTEQGKSSLIRWWAPPVPQAWLEVDVADIKSATDILEQAGYRLLVRLQQEPWGQTVTRFLSPEGILTAITDTPFLRDEK